MPDRLAVFPGSFDPFTVGHADLVGRAAALFDRVVVAILVNPAKRAMFTAEERRAMILAATAGRAAVEVDVFEGLLVDYAARRQATAVVRGLRTSTDFDYELQMALMNRHLRATVETVFLATSADCAFVSGSLVREVIALGGPLAGLVPDPVRQRIEEGRRPTATRRA